MGTAQVFLIRRICVLQCTFSTAYLTFIFSTQVQYSYVYYVYKFIMFIEQIVPAHHVSVVTLEYFTVCASNLKSKSDLIQMWYLEG